jgi:hypothetical protein
MKRVSTVCAIAALVATALPLSSATAQTWEIHQYFGNGSNGAPGNPSVSANPGTTVLLPVWIRMQGGDSTAQPAELLTSYLFGVSGQITGGTGVMTNFSAGGASANAPHGTYADPLMDLTNAYSTVTGVNAPAGNFNLVNNMGYQSSPPGTTSIIGSRGGSLPPDDSANGAWMVGTVAITIAPGTAPGTVLNLWFRTGQNTPLSSAPYGTTDQTAGATTVAFGVDGAGNPNATRFGATALVTGRAVNFFSSLADAQITVAPEPGTIGLLALGLLALRRRRSC